MKTPMIRHEHLKTLLEDIYLNGNTLTEDFTIRLVNELRYSNLIIPARSENGTLNFIIYDIDDLRYTALFTDRDEFNKFYKSADIRALDNPFEVYQNIVKLKDIDGFILNPASQNYIMEKDLILSITPPKLNSFTTDSYSEGELKEIYDSLSNDYLEEFLNDPANVANYLGLFEAFSKSTLIGLMLSARNLKSQSKNGIISMKETGPLAFMHTDRIGGEYATVFSAKDRLNDAKTDPQLFKYAQIINTSTLVNYVLTEDMDGIILNPESDNVLIPRAELLRNSNGFEKFCNDKRLCDAIFYLFEI